MTDPRDDALNTETGATPITVVGRLVSELSASLHSSVAQRDLADSQNQRFVQVAHEQADRISSLEAQLADAHKRHDEAEAAAQQAALVADSVSRAIDHLKDSLTHLGVES